MKALVVREYGPIGSHTVEDWPDPEAKPGEVVIKVDAAGLNFPDTLMVKGLYQFKPDPPFIPGSECAGTVLSVGEGVTRFKPGDAVNAVTLTGAFAEQIAVPQEALLPRPDSMSADVGAGFSLIYGTSYYALKQLAQIKPGETLLVLGASGGVGRTAVELGKAMGARVIAAASTDEKLAVAKEAGADELLNYAAENFSARVKELTGGNGADVVYDPVGGDFTEAAVRRTAWAGRYLVVGFAAGDIPSLPLNLVLVKGISLIGVFWGSWIMRDPKASAENFRELMEMHAAGKINPLVSGRYGLSDFADALGQFEARQVTGKIVLVP